MFLQQNWELFNFGERFFSVLSKRKDSFIQTYISRSDSYVWDFISDRISHKEIGTLKTYCKLKLSTVDHGLIEREKIFDFLIQDTDMTITIQNIIIIICRRSKSIYLN